MNIGLFTDTYFPQINGVATSVYTLAHALKKRGHQVYIFTPSDPKADPDESDHIIRMPSMPFLLLKNYRVGTMYSPLTLAKISHLHLDIVHTQTEFPLGTFGRFLAKSHRIPMVHTYHTMYEDYVHYLGRGLFATPTLAREFSKLFCNAADDVVAPTEKAKQSLLDYGVKKPMTIIPTGIDTALFAKENFDSTEILALKESFGFQPETPVLLFLGRVAKEKSIDVLIHAMPKLLQECPTVMFLIVGDGPEKENLVALADSLGVTDHVVFAGAKPWNEIGKYYQLATVFASASLSETQGLTFAEAMAGGIPVVAKKDECIEALIEHGKTGLLFETDESLADLFITLFQDKGLQQSLSENSMKKMNALSVEVFAENMEKLYENLITSRANESKIPLAVRPVIASVRAVRRLGAIPKKMVSKQRRQASILIGNLSAPENLEAREKIESDELPNKKTRLFHKKQGELINPTWKNNLRTIAPYVPGEQSKNNNIIKLNANENPYAPSPKVIATLKEFDCTNLRQYPNSSADVLKEAAAKHFSLQKDQIFVGNGSDEVIAMAFLAFFNSEKPILFPDITYSFYPVWCSLFEKPYKTIAVQEDFTINPSDYFLENGGILIPNPNAPTSIGEGETFLRQILEHNQDSVVIIDEAYVDFGGYSAVPLLKEYENLLIIHTFSKSRSLAGIRVGMALGSETLINTLEAIKNSYNSYTIDSIGMALATASISDETYFTETTNKIIRTRQRVATTLTELGFIVCESQANFLFLTHPSIEAKEMFVYLKEQNIFIRHFDLPRITNHLRITIGTDEEMDTLLAEIKIYIKNQ